MNKFITDIRKILADRFHLQDGKAEESVIIDSVKNGIDFKGANLFALIFAIFIASIGLNVNSTAVIIGAMLISPIMGPVMGVGLGIGINDLALVRRGLKNLLVATVISLIASTLYFLITPLHDAQSELLARTSPSIWDVFIAFFGKGGVVHNGPSLLLYNVSMHLTRLCDGGRRTEQRSINDSYKTHNLVSHCHFLINTSN